MDGLGDGDDDDDDDWWMIQDGKEIEDVKGSIRFSERDGVAEWC